jgi:amino acid adenylation domain-containing protein
VALLGVLAAGAGYVPLEPDYPDERLAYMAADAGVRLILATEALAERARTFGAEVLVIDGVDWWSGEPAAPPAPAPAPAPDDAAYAIYTSGTTGRPKGVPNTHRGIVNRLVWMQRAYRLSVDDVVLQKTPTGFDVSVWEFFWPLIAGARLVMADPGGHRDPAYLHGALAEYGVTTVHFVPSMLAGFLDQLGRPTAPALRRVICSGEELPIGLAREFTRRLPWSELHNLYGPTEAAVDVTAWHCRPDRLAALRAVPIGTPIDNIDVHVLDPAGTPVPAGAQGELHIAGVGLARGYLGRPGLTAAKFVPNPLGPSGSRLYRTGDLASRSAEGLLDYHGRIDRQVKLRGVRVELGEIEAVLRSLPGVRDAVVVLRADRPGDERLVGYLTGDQAPSARRIRTELGRLLPAVMVPAIYVYLDSFPLTGNGKLDRAALPPPGKRQVVSAVAQE